MAVYCVTANVPVDILYKLDTDKGGTEVINVKFLTAPATNEFKKVGVCRERKSARIEATKHCANIARLFRC